MTLDDASVERYSRQILLPEVGGRGQERLCAAHVVVTGEGPAAAFAASLLAGAGVRVACVGDGAPDTLSIQVGDREAVVARLRGTHAAVVTLTGRPCARCVPDEAFPPAGRTSAVADPATEQIVGALAAGEAIRLVLGIATGSRVQRVDLEAGLFDGAPLPPGWGCAHCAAAS